MPTGRIDSNLVASFYHLRHHAGGSSARGRESGDRGNRNRGKRRDNCQKCIRYGNRTDRQKRDYDQAKEASTWAMGRLRSRKMVSSLWREPTTAAPLDARCYLRAMRKYKAILTWVARRNLPGT